jgi:hypothetical protein
LYASYNDHIEFLIVYIREAHPEKLKEGNETAIVGRPKTLDERVILATECVSKYKFTIPMVIDGMDGKVNRDYQAAPVRVTVTDIDGKVAFYAGRGPRDFRLPPVERTLKKLIANGGHMPPPPAPQWGRPANGLCCALSFDLEKLTVGEGVAVRLKFENTTDEPIDFYYRPADAIKCFVINNDSGQTLKIQTSGKGRRSRKRKRDDSPIKRIQPGQTFETGIEGKIILDSDQEGSIAGQFNAIYHLDINDQTQAQIEPAPTEPVWTGKLSSGTFTFSVTLPEQDGCIDCHSGSDYHHAKLQACTVCHMGEAGSGDFDVKDDACAHCHPRDGVYSRRQILGPGGEFDMVSKHISGTIEDKDCLLCHDDSQHGNGVVSLIDPDSGGTEPWTGTRTDFCLTCHDGQPPSNVSFPGESTGSGFDKLRFLGSTLAQTEEGCSNCHTPHGSPYPSLLENLHSR